MDIALTALHYHGYDTVKAISFLSKTYLPREPKEAKEPKEPKEGKELVKVEGKDLKVVETGKGETGKETGKDTGVGKDGTPAQAKKK